MKFIKWLLKSLIISLVLLFLINSIGAKFNINIPINIWTMTIVSIFRIPGAIILLIFLLI